MSARIVLVLDAAASTLEYALVDVDRERTIADGRIDGIGTPDATASHTEHFFAEPGEPTLTVLAATAESRVDAADPDAAIAVLLDQFRRHGPSLDEVRPVAVARVGVDGGPGSEALTALPGILQIPVAAADSPLHAARQATARI